MIFAFLYTQVFFGIVQVIWCKPQDFKGHRNWGLLPHDHCGHSNASSNLTLRIFGGGSTNITRLPWIVKVYFQETSGKHFPLCGGTVINNRYVLSAAHCVVKFDYKYLSIGLGGTSKYKDDLYIKVQNFTIHPNYSTCESVYAHSAKNDISLIRLEKEIVFKDNIQPICLPFDIDVDKFAPTTSMEIAGWGGLPFGREGPDTLQYANVTMLNKWNCSEEGVKYLVNGTEAAAELDKMNLTCIKPLDQTQLCMSGGAGRGDSGTPLMKSITVNGKPTYFLLGITSYFVMNVTTIYTSVHESLKWILDQIKP